jgi:hypothetical protein
MRNALHWLSSFQPFSMRYFLIGFMGSGKTYWANQWGSAFQLPVYDLDEEIEKQAGKSVAAIFREDGEDAFLFSSGWFYSQLWWRYTLLF